MSEWCSRAAEDGARSRAAAARPAPDPVLAALLRTAAVAARADVARVVGGDGARVLGEWRTGPAGDVAKPPGPASRGEAGLRLLAEVAIPADGREIARLRLLGRDTRDLGPEAREILACLGDALAPVLALGDPGPAGEGGGSGACRPAGLRTGPALGDEAYGRCIADATSDLVAFWGADLRCRFANGAYKVWFGIDPDEMLGRHLSAVLGADLFQANRPYVEGALAGTRQEFERAIVRPDGSVGHTLAKYLPQFDGEGAPVGFYAVVVDVTQLKLAMFRLAEAEAQFRTLCDSLPQGVFRCDARGRWVYRSDRAVEILSAPGRDDAEPAWQAAILDGDRQDTTATWDRAIREGRPLDLDFRIAARGGEMRSIRLQARPVRNPSGALLGFVGTVEDVTDRETARIRLVDSEARYRLLAEASTDVVQHLDLDGRRIYVSPASVEVYGHRPEALLGTRFPELCHPDDAERLAATLDRLRSGADDVGRSIHRIRRGATDWVWVEAKFRLVRDPATGVAKEIVANVRDVTERETLSRGLAEAKRDLDLAEAIAHVGHWKLAVSTGALTWSDGVYAIHGLDKTRFVPTVTSALAAYHPDDRARVEDIFATAMAAQSSFEFTLRIVRPGGEIRHMASRGFCDSDPVTGRLALVFGVVMDVTDQMLAEEVIQLKSSLLETTLDAMDQGLVKVAPDGSIEFANRRFTELFGASAAVGADLASLGGLLSATAGRSAGPEARAATGEGSGPDGSILDVRAVSAPDGGRIVTIADVTQRRRAEAAIQEGEARYRFLAEATSDVISRLDPDLNLEYVSGACRRVLGFAPEDLIGRGLLDWIHPEDAGAVLGLVTDLLEGRSDGDRATATYRTRHRSGDWVWIETAMTLVRHDGSGAPACITGTMRDVSERQRTALALEEARVAAEQAAIAKAEFLANMSHELRTPLTGLLGVHDLLAQSAGLGREARRLLNLASQAGRALLTIVNDVLDFSKIEAGQLTVESMSVDVRELVEDCVALMAEAATRTGVVFDHDIAPDLPARLTGDITRMRQVLLNLLTNAAKFTERGRIRVRADYAADTGLLRIAVSDTGIGIPADKLTVIFDRFSQADTSTTRRYGGSGLGLAISKRLVELLGGRIGVSSVEGQGSTFWFTLPMPIEAAGQAQQRFLSGGLPGAGRRILVAEDNDTSREVLAAMLAHRGYRVTAVVDGEAAVRAVQEAGGLDLVLMDLQMPALDGLSATAKIRSLETHRGDPPLPIIGLTANAMEEDVARCIACGMNAHVAKPIVWPELFGAIDALLGGGAGQPSRQF